MSLHEDFLEPRLPVHREQADVPEALPYTDEPISTYEDTYGKTFTESKLNLQNTDTLTTVKMRAVDEYIRETIFYEGLRDSQTGYNTVFSRLLERTGFSFEEAMRSGKSSQIINALFTQIALINKQSSATYLKNAFRQYNIRKVEVAKQQLETALKSLVI